MELTFQHLHMENSKVANCPTDTQIQIRAIFCMGNDIIEAARLTEHTGFVKTLKAIFQKRIDVILSMYN